MLRSHGVRGEVIVALVTDRTERLDPGSVLTTAGRELRVERAGSHAHRWIVKFAGIADRNMADALRGAVLYAEPLVEPGTLWVHELIGCEVVDAAGASLGTVSAVQANPASDLLVLDNGGLVPLRFVTEHRTGRIAVDVPRGLLD